MTKPKKPWRCQKCSCTGLGTIPRAYPRSKLCAWCANELGRTGQRWCSSGRHATADWASASSTMCRACQRTHNQAYRHARLDAARAESRAYYAEHRDELIARNRAYYAANRDQLLEQKKVYYQERRELIKAKVRAHRRYRSQASIARERARHHARHQTYKYNEKLARARRFMQSLRGAS